MTTLLEHWRFRRSVPLLGAGALDGRERDRVAAHVARCAECRAEHDAVSAFLARLGEDPLRGAVRSAETPVSVPVLVGLVERRLDAALRAPRPARTPWRIALPATVLAALVGIALVPHLVTHEPTPPAPEGSQSAPLVSEDALDRLERNVAREQAARYLNEAQDVLATMAASPRDCERGGRRVDVEAESRRSRELLARRALLLDVDGPAVASAQPVLEDVEEVLREVASMEACARFRDVEKLRQEIEKRQLLMKMRLMQRELLG